MFVRFLPSFQGQMDRRSWFVSLSKKRLKKWTVCNFCTGICHNSRIRL